MDPFAFEEEIRFLDVGTRDVVYLQRAWDPVSGATLHAETGIWRCTPEGVLAATVAQPRTAEVSEGTIRNGIIELASTSVGRASGSAGLAETRRRYRLSEDVLEYDFAMATTRVQEQAQHLMAQLRRDLG
jgi:hypothetical protein